MPGYIENMLKKFNHKIKTQQYTPFSVLPIQYGLNSQDEIPTDSSERFDDSHKTLIQQIIGTLLYYARAIDMTLLAALSTVASQQSKPTKQTIRSMGDQSGYFILGIHLEGTRLVGEFWVL